MTNVPVLSIEDAQDQMEELIVRAERGEEIVIGNEGVGVARLIAFTLAAVEQIGDT